MSKKKVLDKVLDIALCTFLSADIIFAILYIFSIGKKQ